MIKNFKNKIFSRTKTKKIIFFLASDIILIALACWLGFLLRFDGKIPTEYFLMIKGFIGFAIPITLFFFWLERLYAISWSFVSISELIKLGRAVIISFLLIGTTIYILKISLIFEGFPRSIIFISGFLVFLFCSILRFAKRIYLQGFKGKIAREGKRVLIVGAGEAGEQLIRHIIASKDSLYSPIGMVDDNPMKQGILIHGVRVLGKIKDIPQIITKEKIKEIIIAMPSASSEIIRKTVDLVRQSGIEKIKILPSTREILAEKVTLKHLRDISIEDLLSREKVNIDTQTIENFIRGKTVLITGAAGSIGSELCRQILKFKPAQLIGFDQNETATFHTEYDINKIWSKFPSDKKPLFIIGDICDKNKVNKIFAKYKPEIVFHAAAYKHVPMMEIHPDEAVKNNIFGTLTIGQAALKSGADKFIFISCLDEKTKILTSEGLKRWNEIKSGMKTLSLNYKGEIEENEIEEVVSQKYSGPMFQIKTCSIDMLVTPNHKMVIQLPNNSAKIIEEEAKKTVERSVVYIPTGRWKGIDEKWFSLSSLASVFRHPLRNFPSKVKTSDILYLLGIFIGNSFLNSGYKRRDGRKTDNYGSIFLDIPKKDKTRKKILATLDRMRIAYKCYKGKAGEHIYFNSKGLAEVFSTCGKGAKNKTIPNWALKYSPRLLQSLLDGLIDSGGYRYGTQQKLSSTSPKLMEKCAELATKLGLHFTVSIQKNKETMIKNKKILPSQAFIGIFSKTNHRTFNKKHCKQVNYRGTIWCVRVKNNHNFLAERNGKFFFTGNTDKAVNPTSIMGATKQVGEMICRWLNCQNSTRFCAVRFGNVLDSQGNVVGIFEAQIKKGGPVEITHPEMKRYFMVTSEACLLVMQAGAIGQGGEVFVLDMGEPLKIVDLAREMIKLSGYEPDVDIPIVFTKPRPGEKLFEEILTDSEIPTKHEKIFIAKLSDFDEQNLLNGLDELKKALEKIDKDYIIKVLKKIVPTYRPSKHKNIKNLKFKN